MVFAHDPKVISSYCIHYLYDYYDYIFHHKSFDYLEEEGQVCKNKMEKQ